MVYHTKVQFEQEKTVPTFPSILKSPKVTCIYYNCYLINEQAIAQCDYFGQSIKSNHNPTILGKIAKYKMAKFYDKSIEFPTDNLTD